MCYKLHFKRGVRPLGAGKTGMYDQATRLRIMAKEKKHSDEESSNSGSVRTIAITSGKGGVGKTSIAANLGLAIATQNKRVGIIDADLGLANIDVILKLTPKYNIEHVISGKKKLSEIFVKGPAGLTIIPASPGRSYMANLSESERSALIMELLRSAANFDITLIDTAAGISNNVIDFALAAREVIVITTPEPTAVTDAYAMIKVISQRKKTDVGIVVNMAGSPQQGQEVAERIIMAAKRFISVKAHFVGYILADAAMSNAISAQQPLIFKYPGSNAAQCIAALANRIIGGE